MQTSVNDLHSSVLASDPAQAAALFTVSRECPVAAPIIREWDLRHKLYRENFLGIFLCVLTVESAE